MGILDGRTQAEKIADSLADEVDRKIAELEAFLIKGRSAVWGKTELTQAIFNRFGARAVKLVQFSAAMNALLSSFTGKPQLSIVTEGWSIDPHEDGTVTVVPPPEG